MDKLSEDDIIFCLMILARYCCRTADCNRCILKKNNIGPNDTPLCPLRTTEQFNTEIVKAINKKYDISNESLKQKIKELKRITSYNKPVPVKKDRLKELLKKNSVKKQRDEGEKICHPMKQ